MQVSAGVDVQGQELEPTIIEPDSDDDEVISLSAPSKEDAEEEDAEEDDEDDEEEDEAEENAENDENIDDIFDEIEPEMVKTKERNLPKAKTMNIEMFHPKLKQHNYDEIIMRANIQRDSKGNINDPFHQTVPVLSRYERARILGTRAKQINHGSRPLVSVPQSIIDGYKIAEKELEKRAIPFIIRRPIPNGESEYWRVSDLELVDY
jgi:DNA-directed RNA polymerase subunit K/omega